MGRGIFSELSVYNRNEFALSTSGRRSGGFLWLGEDSLRVAKHDQALIMLNKSLEHNPEDYKPYVALAFLAAEKGNLTQAITRLHRALLYTANPLHKSYVLLLLSRIHELNTNLEDAHEFIREALTTDPHFIEARYRHAVILAKKGATIEALSILKDLIAREPDFYLKVLLDPALQPVRSKIGLLTKELFEQAKIHASNFSSLFGIVFGAAASIHWLYKNFDHLYSKMR